MPLSSSIENLEFQGLISIPKAKDIQLAWAFVLGIAFLIFTVLKNNKKQKSGAKIPGRLGIPILGETLSFLAATYSPKGCYEFVRTRRLRYGNCFKTSIMGKTHVFLPSVEGAKIVYAGEFGLFRKTFMKSMADLVGPKSVFIVPKGIHERMRRLMLEPFSMNHILKYVPQFDKIVSERLRKLEGKSFRVLDFTMKLGFDVLCNTLMGVVDETLLDELEKDTKEIYDGLLSFPFPIPGTKYYTGFKARKRIMKKFKAIIADRRSGRTYSDDFLQSLLRRDSYPPNEKMDDEEILDNLLSGLISGQNTTATAMMWIVKHLCDNQHIQDKLREEQLSVLKDGLLTYDDLTTMSYASKVIKETLRMSNVIVWTPRKAADDCTIDGFEIKKGWHVNVDLTHIHYDPATYKDPMRFDPSRFDVMQKPFTYMPFGAGPRTCLGINMAKVTMLVFVHRLTTGYRWTLDDEDPGLEMKGFIPRLRNGCPITLRALNRD